MAYQAIWEGIATGRFGMGDRLNESHIAADLGINRGPVREAIRRLGHEGLVVDKARQGSYVRRLGAEDIIDVYNLRMSLETVALRLAITRRPSTARLEAVIEQMTRVAAAEDIRACVEADFDFHEQLCEASGNAFIAHTFRTMTSPIRLALTFDNAGYPDLKALPGEHLELVRLIRAGDQSEAAPAVFEHITAHVAELLAKRGATTAGLLGMSADRSN
jgi:DNA-binding GntR family transcriptional regulator